MTPEQVKTLVTKRFIPPAAYRAVLEKLFDRDWVEWEPETVWSELKDKSGVVPSEEVRNKINALKLFLSRDNFWEDFHAFEKIILAFNDRYIEPFEIQVCTPEELSYGISVANEVKRKTFAPEVINYIRACCQMDGLVVYPKYLAFAQPAYTDKFQTQLVEKIGKIWDVNKFKDIALTAKDEMDPVKYQVGRLHDIDVYVQERLAAGLGVAL